MHKLLPGERIRAEIGLYPVTLIYQGQLLVIAGRLMDMSWDSKDLWWAKPVSGGDADMLFDKTSVLKVAREIKGLVAGHKYGKSYGIILPIYHNHMHMLLEYDYVGSKLPCEVRGINPQFLFILSNH